MIVTFLCVMRILASALVLKATTVVGDEGMQLLWKGRDGLRQLALWENRPANSAATGEGRDRRFLFPGDLRRVGTTGVLYPAFQLAPDEVPMHVNCTSCVLKLVLLSHRPRTISPIILH